MKVLLITHATFFQPDQIVSGNSIRAYYLIKGLMDNGVEVAFAYPKELAQAGYSIESSSSPIDIRSFESQSDLHRLVREIKPQVILVGYWEMLEYFPDNYEIPIIADLIAPRLLEALFQQDQDINVHASRMIALYRKASRFICGTERQRQFLIPWLILAGFDCRFEVPVDIIPISTEPLSPRQRSSSKDFWTIVTGGVSWPWRMGARYINQIAEILAEGKAIKGQLLILSGSYVYQKAPDSKANSDTITGDDTIIKNIGLLPYGEMENLFRKQCDIGIELSDYNIEREFSSSFRSIEFMRCGLPVICNHTLELADKLREYDAGWIIDSPDELPDLLQTISAASSDYNRKSANAVRLVNERHHYLKTIQPLLDYLQHLSQPQRRTGWFFQDSERLITDLHQQIADLHQQIRDRDIQLVDSMKHIDKLQQQLNEVLQSSSWRLTLPLRVIADKVKTVVGRLRQASAGYLRQAWKTPEPLQAFAALKPNDGSPLQTAPFDKPYDRKGRYVAIVTRHDIFPANHGAAVKIERTAWGLSHFVDGVFLITGDWGRYHVFNAGTATEKYFPRPIRLAGLLGLLRRKKLVRLGVPFNEAYLYQALYDWSFFIRLSYLALQYRMIFYQAEFPAYARPCLWVSRLFPGKTLLVEHNVECDRIKTQYPDTSPQAYAWLRRQEVELCNKVDVVIAVSEPDRDLLIAHGVQPSKVHVVPHGVDLSLFDQKYEFSLREAYRVPADAPIIVYHGIYSYKPNLESVQLLATEILPRLKARGWYPKMFAIGPEPPVDNSDPDVVFTGPVDNLAPYLKCADIAVVPLQQGGGTRMKILEYFAAQVPVVTTSKGVEGIPVQNGVQLLIEDTFDGIAEAVIQLLQYPEKARFLAGRAREFVADLDWKRIAERYLKLLE